MEDVIQKNAVGIIRQQQQQQLENTMEMKYEIFAPTKSDMPAVSCSPPDPDLADERDILLNAMQSCGQG